MELKYLDRVVVQPGLDVIKRELALGDRGQEEGRASAMPTAALVFFPEEWASW